MEITVERSIAHPPEDVYRAARKVELFPRYMDDLKSAEILSEDGDERETRWVGKIAVGSIEREFAWTERDVWNSEELTCSFELVEGDMDEYSGQWRFSDDGEGGCTTELYVEFELDIPMLGSMVNDIVEQKVKENSEQLLQALDDICRNEL